MSLPRLKINSEFKRLIPPLSSEEFEGLAASIKSEGCRDAVIAWKGTIVDGHNRFRICTEHKIPFRVQIKTFHNIDEVKVWIIKNQFGRRNLSILTRAELALKMEQLIARQAKENQRKGHQKCDNPVNTLKDLGKIAGVSHTTMHKVRVILKSGRTDLRDAVEKGRESINSAYSKITKRNNGKYWLIPPDLYKKLDAEFHFCYDPCPYPLPKGFNGLTARWGRSNFVNPPFRQADAKYEGGPGAFIKKAVKEAKRGKSSVFVLPVPSYINTLLEAGAELRSGGRVPWLEIKSKQPMPWPPHTVIAILKAKQ